MDILMRARNAASNRRACVARGSDTAGRPLDYIAAVGERAQAQILDELGDEIERLRSDNERMREALRLIVGADDDGEFGLINDFDPVDEHPVQSPFLAHALGLARSVLSQGEGK